MSMPSNKAKTLRHIIPDYDNIIFDTGDEFNDYFSIKDYGDKNYFEYYLGVNRKGNQIHNLYTVKEIEYILTELVRDIVSGKVFTKNGSQGPLDDNQVRAFDLIDINSLEVKISKALTNDKIQITLEYLNDKIKTTEKVISLTKSMSQKINITLETDKFVDDGYAICIVGDLFIGGINGSKSKITPK